jgi:ATP-dependent DNA helicase MPH1
VQRQITKGELYELYGDVERLIPDHIKPECIEKLVEIQRYVHEKKSPRKKAADTQGTKRKRNDDMMRNIPEGASTGFVSVRDLVAKQGPKTKKVKMSKDFDACGKDDETDEDIESGRIIAPPRRTQSAAAGTSHVPGGQAMEKGKKKAKLRKSSTMGSKPSKTRKKKVETLTSSQFVKQGSDDSDDLDIELGAISVYPRDSNRDSRSPLQVSDNEQHLSPRRPLIEKAAFRTLSPVPETPPRPSKSAIVELTDSEQEPTLHKERQDDKPSSSPAHMTPNRNTLHADEDMGWIVDDDEDDLQIEIVNSSPTLDRISVGNESLMISQPEFKRQNSSSKPKTLADDSVVEIIEDKLAQKGKAIVNPISPFCPQAKGQRRQPHMWDVSSSPSRPTSGSMPPPALPRRFHATPPSPFSIPCMPEATYPVRQVKAKRKRLIIDDEEAVSSPHVDDISKRRLRKMESTPPKKLKKAKTRRVKPTILGSGANPLFHGEATHSGDEVSEGGSNSEDDVESESDRQFIKDSPLTQASQSYDQSQIYRRSLMTQFAGDDSGAGLAFSNGPVRPKPFGRIEGRHLGDGLPSSSPPLPDEELDTYEFGSFVVADDDF